MDPSIPPQAGDPLEKGGEYGILEGMATRRTQRNYLRIILLVLIIAALGYAAYWIADRQGWLRGGVPQRLPTAEERARMEQVEESSNTVAPDAIPGAGVRPRGTLPPQESLSPATTTDETTRAEEPIDERTDNGANNADTDAEELP